MISMRIYHCLYINCQLTFIFSWYVFFIQHIVYIYTLAHISFVSYYVSALIWLGIILRPLALHGLQMQKNVLFLFSPKTSFWILMSRMLIKRKISFYVFTTHINRKKRKFVPKLNVVLSAYYMFRFYQYFQRDMLCIHWNLCFLPSYLTS